MNPDNPLRWLARMAAEDPDRVALVTPDGEISYHQLHDMVAIRAAVLQSVVVPGQVEPVLVRVDVPSVVEILAVALAGAVPLPHVGEPVSIRGDAVAGDHMCIATSGTSGITRVVRITDANIAAAVSASRGRLDTGEHDRWLLCLPIHHVGGLSVLWRSFEAGGSVAMAPFDPDLASFVAMTRPTIASMVPTMVHRMLRTRPDMLASIPRILVGGARLSPGIAKEATASGVGLITTYGATEAVSQVATGKPDLTRPELVGAPLDGFDVSILDDSGHVLGSSRPGRIAVGGPAVSPGYLGEEPRSGPWVSDDVGSLDDMGNLHVHGRADDMVVTGGENVFVGSVADVLRAVQGVDDVYVCGVPDDEWGAALVAVYAGRRPASALETEARRQLPPHAVPKGWVRVAQLPTLPNHKYDRVAIQSIAATAV